MLVKIFERGYVTLF